MLNQADLSSDRGPFSLCDGIDEILIVVHQLFGLDAVDRLLTEGKATNAREPLQDAASRFARIGLKPLAQLVRRHARRAKPSPWRFQRQTKSALIYIARRSAEAGLAR